MPLAALALAGCGPGVTAPSLMPRAVEKQPIDMPATSATEQESTAPSALTAQIATLVKAAEAGDAAFATQRAQAEKAVVAGAGAGQGSEAWVAAQEAVSALEAARAPVRDAAAQLDTLRQDPVNATTGGRAAIDAAAARMTQIDDAESAALATLVAKLG